MTKLERHVHIDDPAKLPPDQVVIAAQLRMKPGQKRLTKPGSWRQEDDASGAAREWRARASGE
jgi:hypothetical protein